MARETEGDVPVEAPADGAGATPAASAMRWPTWEDVSRLHAIPGPDGEVPPPAERPAAPAGGAADGQAGDAAEVSDEAAADDEVAPGGEPASDDEAAPGDEAVVGDPPTADEAAADDEPIADGETVGEPGADGDEPVVGELASRGEAEADDAPAVPTTEPDAPEDGPVDPDPVVADDATVVMAPIAEADDRPGADEGDETGPASGSPDTDGDGDDAPADASSEPPADGDDEPEAGTPEPRADPVVPDDATVLIAPVVDDRRDEPVPHEAEPAEDDAESASDQAEPVEDAAEPAADEPSADGPAADEPPADEVEPSGPVTDAVVAAEPTVVLPAVTEQLPPASAEPTVVLPPPAEAAAAPASAEPTVVLHPAAEPPTPTPAPAEPTVVLPAAVEPPEAAAPQRVSAFPATSSAPTASPRVTAGPVPVAEREASVLDEFSSDPHRRHWPRNLAIVLGAVVLLGGAYVGACYALGDRVPHGATVAGVDIGGLASADAVRQLTTALAPATDQPLTVTANDVQAQLDPKAAGLSFDPQATVDSLTGVRLAEPARLWRQIVGVGEVAPSTAVDTGALAAALDGLSATLSAVPVDGSIVFVDGSPHATPAQDGWTVDADAAVTQIADTWLVAARPLALPTVAVEPDVTQAETDQVLADVAQRVSGGPVAVTVGDSAATLDAPTLAAAASFVPQDGSLVLHMDGQALVDAVVAQVPGALTAAADARFEFQNDAPVVVPGTPGTTLDPDQVASAVGAAASKPADRTAALQLVPTDPAQSTAALEQLGITQVVGEFDTPLTSDHIRDINIRQGAQNITGVLIRPGEEFSLTQALGPVDKAHGFVDAGAIVNGQHTDAVGGGLSQLSTTTFNAAYLAGFEIVEHHPHSEYFQRYPAGREATIFTGQLDMRWKNNTPYGALVQAWVADGKVHVRIWGTAYWRVESESGDRTNVHQPTIVYSQSPTCQPQSKGNPGFTIKVTRRTYLGDELKNTETWTTTYKAQNQIVCGPPPAG